jgi:hypothetical protein
MIVYFFTIQIVKIISLIENFFSEKINDYHETRFGMSFSIKFKGILFTGDIQTLCRVSFDLREKDIYKKPLKKLIRPVHHDLPNYFILALDAEEILAEKVRAIMTRYFDDFDRCMENILKNM